MDINVTVDDNLAKAVELSRGRGLQILVQEFVDDVISNARKKIFAQEGPANEEAIMKGYIARREKENKDTEGTVARLKAEELTRKKAVAKGKEQPTVN